ncbi:MAG TPA: cellulase family glycosylhydrolase, partial [Armatimonadota bacterium]|nr:cellulase family glycosylhydrolase [Armatimonadota bacterium]
MQILVLLVAVFSLFSVQAWGQEPALQPGAVVFSHDFEGENALQGWTGAREFGPGYNSKQALSVTVPTGEHPGGNSAQITIPVEKLRGYLLYFSAMVRAENVSQKPQSWNGIKFMAPVVAPSGNSWPQADIGTGSFAWKRVSFSLRVPQDATSLTLLLGLESVSGTAWFDDVRITVRKLPRVIHPRPLTGPLYTGHAQPRLRGTMVGHVDEESLRVLGKEWNANVLRWQLVNYKPQGDRFDRQAYDAWLDGELKKMDEALPFCRKYGLLVVVDLHSLPNGGEQNLFNDAECQKAFVENWQRIARRYKRVRGIWGYDLANEPIEGVIPENLADWEELAARTAHAIRAIDRVRTLIVEPAQGANPYGLSDFEPIDVPNVVYSVHMYLPHAFTHQGVHDNWSKSYTYPGEIQGQHWDKAQLEAALKPAIDFQKNYGVQIYIGEFSAIRWAPDGSACRYLKDVIDIFEAHGWDWTYHAFREWSGWSVEYGENKEDNTPS